MASTGTMRAGALLRATAAVGALVALAGCDWFGDPIEVNLPPDTEILVCAESRTINAGEDARFVWSGSDLDGTVSAFEWSYDDSAWVVTSADSVNVEEVAVGDHTFKVRAIDDDGDVDPSPDECEFTAVQAGELVDRSVLIVMFTTRACVNCPNAEEALNALMDEMGHENLSVVAYHYEGGLQIPETRARIETYWSHDVPEGRYPMCMFDGLRYVEGADNPEIAEAAYRIEIDLRKNLGSPVSLEVDGTISVAGGSASAKVKVHDELVGGPYSLRTVVIENDVDYALKTFHFVTRHLLEDELTVSAIGDSVTITREFAVDPSWVPDKLEIIAFVQDDQSMEVLQSARLVSE